MLGRDRLDPKAADYTAILTKIKSLNPEALYYGGVSQAGVKLAKQAYDIMPKMIKAGGDGMVESGPARPAPASRPSRAGTRPIASPHWSRTPRPRSSSTPIKRKFNDSPDDYPITAYDAALVIIDAIKRVAASGKPVTREAVRDAIQTAKVPTIQGVVSFDENGDLKDRTVSVFQIQKDTERAAGRRVAAVPLHRRGAAVADGRFGRQTVLA